VIRARLCSQNAHKLGELRAALPGWQLELLDAAGFPAEDGSTYEENARLKARFGRSVGPAGEWMLGEDSGIEAEALGGAPGVNSARWSQGSQSAALLERLAGEPERRARMVTVIVALGPDGREIVARGVLAGTVATERRGTGGFGYDPIFVPDGYDLTVAELGDGWKRANSHRGRAAAALREAVTE